MFERSIEEGLKLRKKKTAEIEREEKNINKELFKRYFTNYTLLSLSDMYKKSCKTEGTRNIRKICQRIWLFVICKKIW